MPQIEQDKRQALTGRAHCSECRATMIRMGPDFICHTMVNPLLESCANNRIDAYRLLWLVVSHIVETVMQRPTLTRLKEMVRSEAEKTSGRYQEQLDQTERTVGILNIQEAEAYSGRVEADKEELNDISNQKAALSYEAKNARREIDTLGFISDEARIEANAMDIDTFLDEATPEHTIEFIDNFVQSVGVGQLSIHLNYKFPIPSEEHPEGKSSYVIPRRGSDQIGIIDREPEEPPQTPATPFPSGKTDENL